MGAEILKTITLNAEIGPDGRLKIDVPTELSQGKHEVVLVVDDAPASRTDGLRISDLVGKLKWRGDAVAAQRRLRDEW